MVARVRARRRIAVQFGIENYIAAVVMWILIGYALYLSLFGKA
jgi:hypothetical protein